VLDNPAGNNDLQCGDLDTKTTHLCTLYLFYLANEPALQAGVKGFYLLYHEWKSHKKYHVHNGNKGDTK